MVGCWREIELTIDGWSLVYCGVKSDGGGGGVEAHTRLTYNRHSLQSCRCYEHEGCKRISPFPCPSLIQDLTKLLL